MEFKEWYTKSAYFGSAPREILEQTWAAAQEEMQSTIHKQMEEILRPFEELMTLSDGEYQSITFDLLADRIYVAKKAAGLEE